MPLSFHLNESSKGTLQVTTLTNTYLLNYPCGDEPNICTHYEVTLPPGSYLFEVWGAQGGLNGGKGGYSLGILRLRVQTKAFIFIGAKGESFDYQPGTTRESFNGGGSGNSCHSTNEPRSASSGGGATDIRLLQPTLYHRILVAGGGGGLLYDVISDSITPAFGGGLVGGSSSISKGGTQEEAPEVNTNTFPGHFGSGGSYMQGIFDCGTIAGGGGGWYGGSTGEHGKFGSGAGGSGYALHSGSFKPENYKLNSPRYFMHSWKLIGGNESFPQCNGQFFPSTSYETGHSGNGCARITILPNFGALNTCQIQTFRFNYLISLSITLYLKL